MVELLKLVVVVVLVEVVAMGDQVVQELQIKDLQVVMVLEVHHMQVAVAVELVPQVQQD